MKTEQISVPSFDGFKCLGVCPVNPGQYVLSVLGTDLIKIYEPIQRHMVVYEKISPKRYIFEEAGECRRVNHGEIYREPDGTIRKWTPEGPSFNRYVILRQVDV